MALLLPRMDRGKTCLIMVDNNSSISSSRGEDLLTSLTCLRVWGKWEVDLATCSSSRAVIHLDSSSLNIRG